MIREAFHVQCTYTWSEAGGGVIQMQNIVREDIKKNGKISDKCQITSYPLMDLQG